MIYIIPKNFNEDWERMLNYIEKLEQIDIKYNPQKLIFPRIRNSKKRGKTASLEIMKHLNSYFISKKNWLEELCYVLKSQFEVVNINGKKIILTKSTTKIDELLFNNHYFTEDPSQVEKVIDDIFKAEQVEGIFINPVEYFLAHFENMELNEKQKLGVKYYEEQIIEHIENPDGRIKYKDQRKISIGVCKKDILSYRSKKKRAFFNCFVVIMRLLHNNEYKEIHLKVFNTGKLEIPGIQNDELLYKVLDLLVVILKPYLNNELTYLKEKNETVLINSNFNCGYYIDRDKLHDILKYKYRINSNFDACSYPGIQCKFYYDRCELIQTGQQPNHKEYDEVSFMIFRTGSVLVVGKCHETTLNKIYLFLRNVLEVERDNVISITNEVSTVNKNRKKKIRKKIIYVDSSCVK